VHGEMESPQVVAKGAGHLAAGIRKIAVRHNIPVVRSPGLARKLSRSWMSITTYRRKCLPRWLASSSGCLL
jgi:flagellar biosynthesis protein FlhB